jgi:nicotinate phosphoribosyltransferase
MRTVAGPNTMLLEFGLRRAQGPDGSISATKYSYVGGFDGTSNVLAGKLTGIPVKGTHAHSYVQSYVNINELISTKIISSTDKSIEVEFVALVLEKRRILKYTETNNGELTAFIAYSQAFPHNLLALVDTYDSLISGVPNFLCVAWALFELGYKPTGIRLDSGDLAYLSRETRALFIRTDEIIGKKIFSNLNIVASNDINEDVLSSLKIQGHEINTFGIGTNLVTCQKQPALGCVYKLVEVNSVPRIKLSQDIVKLTIPGRKLVYRLFGLDGCPILDLMQIESEPSPVRGQRLLCRHPFEEKKRCHVTPTKVERVHQLIWDGPNGGYDKDYIDNLTLINARDRCMESLKTLRTDHTRYMNATPYKVSVTQTLYEFIHNLWMEEAPIVDFC